MTTPADPQGDAQRIGADKIILGLLAALLIGVLFYASSQRQQALRNSATGLDGLQVWLSRDDKDVQNFTGGWRLTASEIGLQILPVYDTRLNSRRDSPTNQEELIQQQDEYDLLTRHINDKAQLVPMLLVLPKWRSGVRLTQLAHPDVLVEQDRVGALAASFVDGGVTINRPGGAFARFGYATSGGETFGAVTYAPQTMVAPECTPIIGARDAMVLAECPLRKDQGTTTIYILTDPDVINNHGLLLGDNAHAMRDWVTRVAGDQRVIIDYSRDNWLAEEITRVQRDRTWSDLQRFFGPPFLLMWAGLALAILLVLWRAGVRFGPITHGPATISASKQMAIAARARLMRLSNRDGALAAEYCKARLAATATALFGAAHARQFSQPEAFLGFVQRRHPTHVMALTEALNMIQTLPPQTPATQAMATIADFDRILELIKNDT